jgi:hypothetical protein
MRTEVRKMNKMSNEEHSRDFSKIRGYYESGFWRRKQVYNAVIKGKIKEAEYEEITGAKYVPNGIKEQEG